jgi:hypothetical protein
VINTKYFSISGAMVVPTRSMNLENICVKKKSSGLWFIAKKDMYHKSYRDAIKGTHRLSGANRFQLPRGICILMGLILPITLCSIVLIGILWIIRRIILIKCKLVCLID